MINKRLIGKIEELVKKACKRRSNPFGEDIFKFHIRSVVKHARALAKKLGADEEIVVIAALLHDYASICSIDFYKEHHIHGARLVGELFKKYKYPKEKIKVVKDCIYTHRGSRKLPKKTLEAKIVASADGMAHFDNVNSLFYAAYVTFGLDVDGGTRWVLRKLERSYRKLLSEGKRMINGKYELIRKIFRKSGLGGLEPFF